MSINNYYLGLLMGMVMTIALETFLLMMYFKLKENNNEHKEVTK